MSIWKIPRDIGKPILTTAVTERAPLVMGAFYIYAVVCVLVSMEYRRPWRMFVNHEVIGGRRRCRLLTTEERDRSAAYTSKFSESRSFGT